MSTAGSLSNEKKISGFTLIELIVVISIIAMLVLFSFPAFRNISLFQDSTSQVDDIIRLINDLKKRAVKQDIDYLLHIDSGSGMIWVTNDAMSDEAKNLANEKGILVSEKIIILDVVFPDMKEIGTREYQIRFRKKGYSDFALIHINDHQKNITLKIEPFLPQVQVLDKQVYLDDCI